MSDASGSSDTELPEVSCREDGVLAGSALGTLQIEQDGQIILMPHPSSDVNDPLNWSRAFKIYVTCVVCLAVWLSNFLAAGPTVDIVEIAISFTGTTYNVSKTAYLFTASALMQGVGMFIWMPLITKYGRRVCYVFAFGFCTLCVLWAGLATDFHGELVARLGIGLFSGGAECLAPLTITDLFFVHERGRYMSFYQTFLSMGVSSGIIVSGILVYKTDDWRNIYWLGAILYGISTLIVIFTFPETAFDRTRLQCYKVGNATYAKNAPLSTTSKRSYAQSLAISNGTFTNESLLTIFLRPFGAILLPAVAWATMVFSVTVGFLVAITSNFAVALGDAPYNFNTLQLALCFISAGIGALLAAPMGGWVGDQITAKATSKNGGIREPEMRLPAIIPHIVIAPFALVLYGVGIQHGLHWMCPAVAFALFNFSTVAATNIAMMYAIEVYKPIAGEVVVAVVGFKGVIGFGLSFGTNLWVDSQGYQNAFGQMAAIAGAFLVGGLVFILWGKKIRLASFQWRVIQLVKWHADRDSAGSGVENNGEVLRDNKMDA